jgi:hypothetical protein
VVIVAVNVGNIAYGRPATGGAAHGTAGTFARAPTSGNMHRLLRQMAPTNEDGSKRVALWALSSTCLPKRDIAAAIADFAGMGYACRESHGVRGDRREEIAGVMICIDPKQLRFLKFTADGRDHRVIRVGRALRVRLGIVGGEDRSTDFDAIVAYMLVRGAGAGSGHTSGAARRAYNEAVWKHLAVSAMPLANQGRLLLMGDMNAETRAALRQRSRQQHASDAALHHLLDLSRMAPLHHERDWTYTDASRSYFSTIDYIIASDSIRGELHECTGGRISLGISCAMIRTLIWRMWA